MLRRARQLGLLLLVIAVLVPAVVALRIWHVGRLDARPRSDTIIVMGAAQYDGRPSPVFAARLAHAAELFRDGIAPRIVTVGSGLVGDEHTEAAAGKQWLAAHEGVPARDVVAVARGHDTLRSLRAASRVFDDHGWRSAVIVTDPWHSLRSRTMARDLGIDAATSPAWDNNPLAGSVWIDAEYIARETAAYLYYAVLHRSTELQLYSL